MSDVVTESAADISGLRVLYFGMLGEFSRIVLEALLDARIEVSAVVIPCAPDAALPAVRHVAQTAFGSVSALPLINPYFERNIVHRAWELHIPVLEVRQLGHAETLAEFRRLEPDVIAVACFTQRVPGEVLALPPLGCLNVHPSLLPAYRGPAPLFWALRNGERTTGVTVHFMDEGLDSGDIALQATVELPDGISGAAADRECAGRGGALLVETLRRVRHGTLPRRQQPDGGSYDPWPAAQDFALCTGWPARQAFNFMRGTAEWGMPYLVDAGGERLRLRRAVSYMGNGVLDHPVMLTGSSVAIQFTPGVLHAEV